MDYAAFAHEVAAGRPRPVYALAGGEDFLIESGLAEIAAALFANAPPDFNYDLFEGDDATAGAILAASASLPMMAPRRLVVVRRADALPAAEQTALADYLDQPASETVLVLTAAKVDRRKGLFAALAKRDAIVDCGPLPPRELPSWIRARAKNHGLALAPEAVAFLAERAEIGLTGLANELAKIAAATGVGGPPAADAASASPAPKPVGLEALRELCGLTADCSVFDLIKAIADKNRAAALERLQWLLDAGEAPLMLLGFLARQMRQFWLARELMRHGEGEAALARAAGVSPYAASQIWRQARGLNETDLRFALGRIAETDAGLKGAAAPPRLLMELLVIDLCAGQSGGLRRFLGAEGLLYLERQA